MPGGPVPLVIMAPDRFGTAPSDDGAEPVTGWQRLSQSLFRPQSPKADADDLDFSRMSDDEKRAHIVRIDPVERKVGLIAAGLGIALAIYANVPYMIAKRAVPSTVKPTGHKCPPHFHYAASTGTCNTVYPVSHYVLPLVVSLVLAAAIYVTVRIRRRAPLSFTMVMTGLAFGSLYVLVPFGVGAGWIMLRAWRTQKYGAPTAKKRLDGWVPPAPRAPARRSRAKGGAKGGKAADSGSTRKGPEANKRYTPKSPPKKKVSPPKR